MILVSSRPLMVVLCHTRVLLDVDCYCISYWCPLGPCWLFYIILVVCRPSFGHAPFLSGLWAIVLWGKQVLPHTTAALVRSMVGFLVLAMRPWRGRLARPLFCGEAVDFVRRCGTGWCVFSTRWIFSRPWNTYRGPRAPLSPMDVEVLAMAWGLRLILNVGCRVAHLFLDNAAAAAFVLLCFCAPVGNLFLQRVFRRLLFVLLCLLSGAGYIFTESMVLLTRRTRPANCV